MHFETPSIWYAITTEGLTLGFREIPYGTKFSRGTIFADYKD